jgi:protein tyrosine phosphatase
MDRSSYFIKDKALFGSFPTKDAVAELEKEGVRYFIDLTFPDENNITPYFTKYMYISFPIKDRYYPENKSEFTEFILKIAHIIVNLNGDEKIYIHCKGGHGRSGIVVSILLYHLFNLTPENALEHTKKSHNNRLVMRDKWRKIGSPQTYYQKVFVHNFCNSLSFTTPKAEFTECKL